MTAAHYRKELMSQIKRQCEGMITWDLIEPKAAEVLANVPELNNQDDRQRINDALLRLKMLLKDHDVTEEQIAWIDEEISRVNTTRQLSLYVEEDDELDNVTIRRYAFASMEKEGVVGIDRTFNYEQLKKLSNGVYRLTGQVKFFVSKETSIYGKIINELFEHPVNIPIATLAKSTKEEDAGTVDERRLFMFGEKVESKYRSIKEIEVPFYVYEFVTEKNEMMIIYSLDQHTTGDYIVTGVTTKVNDLKQIGSTAKMVSKLPVVFAQQIFNRITKYGDSESFFADVKEHGVSRENTFDWPFTLKVKEHGVEQNQILKHPTWFKWLIWAWLIHAPKGRRNKYPFHLMMIGEPGGGKSELINTLYDRSREGVEIFSGSQSTLKRLVPSFKEKPAKMGYLAQCIRYAYCDEFFRAVYRTGDDERNQELVAMMNDLLEHQSREAGSGNSSIKVKMSARLLATTNYPRSANSVLDVLQRFDASFLTRFLVYSQSSEHLDMVNENKDSELELLDWDLPTRQWVAFVDYLRSFPAKYDKKRVDEIYNGPKELLSERMLEHYEARHRHHISCVIDGLIKARCYMDGDDGFEAEEEDYERLQNVWTQVIRSWLPGESIQRIPLEERIHYLPSRVQEVFHWIVRQKRPLRPFDFKPSEIGFSKPIINECLFVLFDNDLLKQIDDSFVPHWWDPNRIDHYEEDE